MKQRTENAYPPLSAASTKGLTAIVTINLQLLNSVIERNDHKLLGFVLSLAASTLSETPALSLAPSATFPTEISAVVCQPLIGLLQQIVVGATHDAANRNSGPLHPIE